MTTAEKIELALIPLLGAAFWLLAPVLPGRLDIGNGLLGTSVLLLLQGLLRDLWLITRSKHPDDDSGASRQALCMCVESTLGVTGIVAGVVLLGIGIDRSLAMDATRWALLVMVVAGFGFLVKDFVLEWRPFRVRRERDHMNLVFSWKSRAGSR